MFEPPLSCRERRARAAALVPQRDAERRERYRTKEVRQYELIVGQQSMGRWAFLTAIFGKLRRQKELDTRQKVRARKEAKREARRQAREEEE